MLFRTLCSQHIGLGLPVLLLVGLLFSITPSDGNVQPPPNTSSDIQAKHSEILPPTNESSNKIIQEVKDPISGIAGDETQKSSSSTGDKFHGHANEGESQAKANKSLGQNKNDELYNNSIPEFNSAALLRGFYVFAGLGAVVVMYIFVRTIRLRRKKSTVRKYGILANREDVEMTPLGTEDDEEETTLFDMTSHSNT